MGHIVLKLILLPLLLAVLILQWTMTFGHSDFSLGL